MAEEWVAGQADHQLLENNQVVLMRGQFVEMMIMIWMGAGSGRKHGGDLEEEAGGGEAEGGGGGGGGRERQREQGASEEEDNGGAGDPDEYA